SPGFNPGMNGKVSSGEVAGISSQPNKRCVPAKHWLRRKIEGAAGFSPRGSTRLSVRGTIFLF
ncbi:MAG: hypothetical protein PHO34_03030, partial [Candidatus Omnitrophica bacterium]|nr:hypothetical protein [Candidatus Omnitrophota bacterium]